MASWQTPVPSSNSRFAPAVPLFAMRGPFDTHALIAQLRKIEAASDCVDRAAFALERYVNTHSR